jgi:hypothetical protein
VLRGAADRPVCPPRQVFDDASLDARTPAEWLALRAAEPASRGLPAKALYPRDGSLSWHGQVRGSPAAAAVREP